MHGLLRPHADVRDTTEPKWAGPLAHAAAALARLDQALEAHPLVPAFLYRARLDAVRRQAAADGLAVDPWHLAALLEGLRLRMDPYLSMPERGAVFTAARHAFDLHQWLAAPDFEQERDIQMAARSLARAAAGQTPLLAAMRWLYDWLRNSGARAPARGVLIRYWTEEKLLRAPVPLTAPAALRADAPGDRDEWVPVALSALAGEAETFAGLLGEMARAWIRARNTVAEQRRKNSRAALAVDILAAAPLISPRALAAGLGMSVSNATILLADFCADGIAVEVSHRSKRRLFGLAGLAPLRAATAPPRRPDPLRGRGRPLNGADDLEAPLTPEPAPASGSLHWRELEYSDLTRWMVQADAAIRRARIVLGGLATARSDDAELGRGPEDLAALEEG
ncbi:MAG: hypothetical protein FWD12_15910 [Alphaproteobacteria bacterium]|nr:hypothetical protein [Alphaproteobacteria bacterium]